MTRLLSFWLLVGAIVILCVVFYRVMSGFLVPMFLAALLVVIFGPFHQWMLKKVKGRRRTAAAMTTAAVLLLVLIPMSLLIAFAALEGRDLVSRMDVSSLKQKTARLRESLDLNIEHHAELVALEERLAELSSSFGKPDVEIASLHREEMSKLEEARLSLATKLELPVAPPEALSNVGLFGSKRARTEQAWNRFSYTFSQANQLLGKIASKEREAVDSDDILFQYEQLVFDSVNRYRDFKTELLGGSLRAWAKESANPTPAEVKQHYESINHFVQENILSYGGATVQALVQLLIGAAIMTISLFFFLLDGPAMIRGFMFLSPLDDRHEAELLVEFSQVSRAVVLATLLSALAQGLLAGVGYYFAGVDSVVLLMLLTTGMALIPFVGAASVWVPVCLWIYLIDGRFWPALLLAIYGFSVISMVDNFIKPYVLHGHSKLHPLLALLSVLGGVTALGPIGILVGPMVVVFLQTLLKILQRELTSMDAERAESGIAMDSVTGTAATTTVAPDEPADT